MNDVRPLPGNGIVAHENGFMLVCGDGALVDELLALLYDVASSGGDGRSLVRRGNRTLAGDADSFDCAMAAPTQDGIAVMVSGTATASVTGGRGDVFLDGRNAITTQDALVPGPITKLELRLPDAGKADQRWRLGSGVVQGGGLEGIPRAGDRPSAPSSPMYAEHQSTVADFAASTEGADYLDQMSEAAAATSAALPEQQADYPGSEFPPPPPPPAPDYAQQPEFPQPPEFPQQSDYPPPPPPPDYAQQPEFPPPPDYPPPDQFPGGDQFGGDQFAPPSPDYGAPDQFGAPSQDYGAPGAAPGMLVLDDGMTLQLDADYLVGRDPERAAEVQSGEARPIRLTDAEGSVSRRHARVSVENGEVKLTDLGSVNGTHIQAPGQAGFYPIQPNDPVTITPGTQVLIGGTRIFRYDPPT